MGLIIVQIMPEFFFDNFFKTHEARYSDSKYSGEDQFEELVRVTNGLPSDATFVEYKLKSRNHNTLELVFRSDEWNEENNYDVVDVTFESYTYPKSKSDDLKEFIRDLEDDSS